MGKRASDRLFRDTDNLPIDPESESGELPETSPARPLPPWKKADPDAYRPAGIAGDEDDLPLDPDDDGERKR